MTVDREFITKSQFVGYLDSVERFKDSISQIKETPEMRAGQLIHKFWENFELFTEIEDGTLKLNDRIPNEVKNNDIIQKQGMVSNLVDVEQKRLDNVLNKGLDPQKYFYPHLTETHYRNSDLRIYGIPDALIRSPEDNGFIVAELKTDFYSDYHKEELAFYKELVDEPIVGGVVIAVSDSVDRGNRIRDYSEQDLDEVNVVEKINRVRKQINQNPELPNYRLIE